jgi:hypothetical protein
MVEEEAEALMEEIFMEAAYPLIPEEAAEAMIRMMMVETEEEA